MAQQRHKHMYYCRTLFVYKRNLLSTGPDCMGNLFSWCWSAAVTLLFFQRFYPIDITYFQGQVQGKSNETNVSTSQTNHFTDGQPGAGVWTNSSDIWSSTPGCLSSQGMCLSLSLLLLAAKLFCQMLSHSTNNDHFFLSLFPTKSKVHQPLCSVSLK